MANNNQKVIITSDLRADMRSVLDGRAPESIYTLAYKTPWKKWETHTERFAESGEYPLFLTAHS